MVNHSSLEEINIIGRASDVFWSRQNDFQGIPWGLAKPVAGLA
jgi:hypothetical protein